MYAPRRLVSALIFVGNVRELVKLEHSQPIVIWLPSCFVQIICARVLVSPGLGQLIRRHTWWLGLSIQAARSLEKTKLLINTLLALLSALIVLGAYAVFKGPRCPCERCELSGGPVQLQPEA
ncbi:hypothetical protein [Methylobacterium durans]|nr:hypothetical protein [Methylobacterium durans]